MAPTVKENEISTARLETAQRAASTATLPGEAANKQQPVALEVPVSVNGARTLEGSDKREPFSETTKTVLIFGNGAVIRLSSSVAPGQLLFLTNEKIKKEVVCQVVKSKNYRNVSGYVELEFTEPVVGFWGMRFPSDRVGSVPQPVASKLETPVAKSTPSVVAAKPSVPASVVKDAERKLAQTKTVIPSAPKVEEPEAPLSIRSKTPPVPVVPVVSAAPVSATPEFTVNPVPVQPVATASVLFDSPRASEVQASILEPAGTQAAPVTSTAPNLLALFDARPTTPEVAPPPLVQVFADPETEMLKSQTLKQHTARLQEQLSNMMFSGEPAVPETVSVQIPHAPAVIVRKELAENAAKALELSKVHTPEPAPAAPVKFEPLATPTQELVDREKTKRLAEQPKVEESAAGTVTTVEGIHIPELSLPTFGNALPLDEEISPWDSGSRSSGKGFLAAATSVASNVQASVASLPVASSPSQPQGNTVAQVNPPAPSSPPALTKTSVPSNSAPNALSVVPAVPPAVTVHNSQPTLNPANAGATTPVPVQPAAEQPKKPILGEVHLAKPKVSPSRRTQNGGEPDAGIVLTNDDQPDPDALNAGLVVGSNQPAAPPAAPLPVGGDVRQAKLISSVPPTYPTLAKNQHVSGNVLVDALIDANGRVTTMKVVSGPTLLHQAAMDALRQWKYQPASLDGKPVPMHLTVTIQFRLQ